MTFREWMLQEYTMEEIADIAQYGCASGFSHLTYYSDTNLLYDKHDEEIWDMLTNCTEDFGYKHELELIAMLNGAEHVHDTMSLKNLLVWYIAEETAHNILDDLDDEAMRALDQLNSDGADTD